MNIDQFQLCTIRAFLNWIALDLTKNGWNRLRAITKCDSKYYQRIHAHSAHTHRGTTDNRKTGFFMMWFFPRTETPIHKRHHTSILLLLFVFDFWIIISTLLFTCTVVVYTTSTRHAQISYNTYFLFAIRNAVAVEVRTVMVKRASSFVRFYRHRPYNRH